MGWFRAVIVMTFLLAPHAFGASAEGENEALQNAVLQYNHGIMKVSKTGDATLLRRLLEEKLYTKTMLWVKSWHDESVFMEFQMESIKFTKIDQRENHAEVETDEKWSYQYLFMKSKEVVYPKRDIFYSMRYTLEFLDGHWVIKDVDILDEKEKIDDPKVLIRPVEKETKSK